MSFNRETTSTFTEIEDLMVKPGRANDFILVTTEGCPFSPDPDYVSISPVLWGVTCQCSVHILIIDQKPAPIGDCLSVMQHFTQLVLCHSCNTCTQCR